MTAYLMHLYAEEGREGDLRAFLDGLAPEEVLPDGLLAFQRGREVVLLMEGDAPRPWERLFEGERGRELLAELRALTNLVPDRPGAHVVPDLASAASLAPSMRPSPEESYSGG